MATYRNRALTEIANSFPYALKHQLRRTDPNPDLLRLLGPEETARLHHKLFRPVAILNDIRGSLVPASETTRWMLDTQINELEKCVGGCEASIDTHSICL